MPFSVWQSVRAAPLASACKTTYSRRISAWNITFSELVAVLEDTIYTRAKRINLRYSHLYQGTEETPGNMEAEWNKLDAFTRLFQCERRRGHGPGRGCRVKNIHGSAEAAVIAKTPGTYCCPRRKILI